MKSAAGLALPLISVRGTWQHAFTTGRALKVTPRGLHSVSGITSSRFNPGDSHATSSAFETLYLALDRETALFEKRVQFGDPFGSPSALVIASRIKSTIVIPVEVNLDAVLDLSDVAVHALLDTNAQEITGDWLGYEKRGLGLAPPMGVLTAPTGLAPTQQLAGELFQDPRIKGIISISAKVPTTRCLVVFTHKMQPPDQ